MSTPLRIFMASTIVGAVGFALLYLLGGLLGNLKEPGAIETALAPFAFGILAGAVFGILYKFLWPDRHQIGRGIDLCRDRLPSEPEDTSDRRERLD